MNSHISHIYDVRAAPSIFSARSLRRAIDAADRTPLYRQIADYLREEMQSGRLKEGTNLAPEAELARCLGVSVITTTQALGLLVNEGLVYRRRRLGTFVGRKKPAPAGLRTLCFVLCRDRLPDQCHSVMLSGVEDGCRQKGITLRIHQLRGAPSALARDIGNGCDGVILAGFVTNDVCRWLSKRGVPFVVVGLLGEPSDNGEEFYQLTTAPERTGELAAEHLIEKGHRRIVLLNGCRSLPYFARIEQGFRRALERHALPGDQAVYRAPESAVRDTREKEGAALAERAMRRRPTGLVCATDLLALGAYATLRHHGVAIPGGISVVSIADIPISQFMHPPLTTVDVDVHGVGREAVDFLEDVVQGKGGKLKRHWNHSRVIERESVRRMVHG